MIFRGAFTAVPVLARRFLLSNSSDQFLSFIAWVSVIGVALGVLALTVVTSVINGFENELTHVITGMNGDVILYSRRDPISDPEKIQIKIKKLIPETQAVTPSFIAELMVSGPTGVAGAVLEGIDGETVGQVTAIPDRLYKGRLPIAEGEVVLASVLADRLGAQEGSEIRLVFPGLEGVGSPKVVQAKVVGLLRMGMYEYDSKYLFCTLAFLQKTLDQPNRVTSFKLRLPGGPQRIDSRRVADRLTESFGPPFRAKDWSQLNKNLFYAIRLEKVVIAIILTIIIIVAAFNVVSTLMMMIHDKTKEIAILKAMGFRAIQSFTLFCLIGMGIGMIGTGVGVLGGLGVNWLLEKTHWIHLPADIYYIGFLPVIVRWREIGLIVGLALIITFSATLYPAIRVSTRSPLDGIRYE